MTYIAKGVDGFGYKNPQASKIHPGILTGRRLDWIAVTSNTAAAANESIGNFALAAIVAGTTGSVTVSCTIVTAASFVWLTAFNSNTDTTAGRGIILTLKSVTASTNFVVEYSPNKDMAADWVGMYLLVN